MSYENLPKNEDNTKVLVQTELVKAAFGELLATSLTPLTQISAQYGLLTDTFTVTDAGSSGSTSVVSEKFTCQTGVAADGLASILTRKQLAYKAGQGATARFTAVFDTPVADNTQAAGLITAENSFAFIYAGTAFGILYTHGGVVEVQELTITVAAAGAETATVTIDGTPYNVSLTGIGTLQGDAYEIAESLSTQVPNYLFTSDDDTVVAVSVLAGARGAYAFSSTGTATAAWSQITAGSPTTDVFIPQASWNGDIKADLNPQLGSVYQISFQYLGFGAIKFFIEDNDSSDFVLVHTIKYSNTNINPSVTNPTFRVGWLATNSGNTSNVTMQGASAAAFIEGRLVRSGPSNSESNDQLSIGSTITNVLAVRNRISFGDKVNRAELLLRFASLSSQTNRTAFFQILVNPTFSAPVTWNYINKSASIAEVTKTSVTVTGGEQIAILTVTDGSPVQIAFNDENADGILAGDILCIAAVIPTGAAADCQATMTWKEDI